MLNISPHPQQFMYNINKVEYAAIRNKYSENISPTGPRCQCLDLASCIKVTPKLLFPLNSKVNKLLKRKQELIVEAAKLKKDISNVRHKISKV
jgi:hypothetical protein